MLGPATFRYGNGSESMVPSLRALGYAHSFGHHLRADTSSIRLQGSASDFRSSSGELYAYLKKPLCLAVGGILLGQT